MSALRDEIRAILREELAALRSDTATTQPLIEQVNISGNAALNRFARDLVARASSPEFVARVARGDIVFELAQTVQGQPAPALVTSTARTQQDVLDKKLITERDIAALAAAQRSLRIARHSRLTPLARDEARRRGIRIERAEK